MKNFKTIQKNNVTIYRDGDITIYHLKRDGKFEVSVSCRDLRSGGSIAKFDSFEAAENAAREFYKELKPTTEWTPWTESKVTSVTFRTEKISSTTYDENWGSDVDDSRYVEKWSVTVVLSKDRTRYVDGVYETETTILRVETLGPFASEEEALEAERMAKG